MDPIKLEIKIYGCSLVPSELEISLSPNSNIKNLFETIDNRYGLHLSDPSHYIIPPMILLNHDRVDIPEDFQRRINRIMGGII